MTDPRFDPAFQRGYAGPEPELVQRAAAPIPSPASASPASKEPGVARVFSPGPGEESGPDAASARQSESGLAIGGTDQQSEWFDQPPHRNPFGIALLASGLLLLLAGGGMIWSFATRSVTQDALGSFDPGTQAIAILDYHLPPALLLGGVLGVLGWLVLGALDVTASREHR